ncbi:lytic transglycosylase domain-containing protein, partial [bacterium]|nr:lytic transglycosylase domain-containing protein [bacterium]
MRNRYRAAAFPAVVLLCLLQAAFADEPFPVPEGLEARVQFWVNIFTKFDEGEAVLCDGDRPERIYEVLRVEDVIPGSGWTSREKYEALKPDKDRISEILRGLAARQIPESGLTDEQRRILRLFGEFPSTRELLRAAECVRAQLGVKQSFRDGLVRSGRYIPFFMRMLADAGLPHELAHLPHVESSFNPEAASAAGATGLWQFTKSTGRLFMTIDGRMDERRDPFLSAAAAMLLLKRNYDSLGRWPLAVTAYNHGGPGIRRAVRELGTTDIGRIIREYKGPSFGFASKNFYPEFVAAVRVAENAHAYFDSLVIEPPLTFQTVQLASPVSVGEFLAAHALTDSVFFAYNPAVAGRTGIASRIMPDGFRIRLPAGTLME